MLHVEAREDPSLPLLASGGTPHSLVCGHIILISVSVFTCLFLFVCLSSVCLFIRALFFGLRAHLDNSG